MFGHRKNILVAAPELKDKTRGLSVFLVDLKANQGKIDVKPLDLRPAEDG